MELLASQELSIMRCLILIMEECAARIAEN